MPNSERRPTAVLADDHLETVRVASEIVEKHFEILAVVNDGVRAVEAVSVIKPDLVLLDIAMPGKDGFEVARGIREFRFPTKIVFLTITEDEEYVRAASDLGASYVLKRRMRRDLLTAAHEALAGRLFISPMPVAVSPAAQLE
jgi:DNA-binding NarL/FixJ family response regulator